MGTQTDSTAAVPSAAQLADYDVTLADGSHRIDHGLAAVNRDLSAGALFAIEAEASNWYQAAAAEYRPEAEAEFTPRVVDLNEAIQAALGGAS